MVGTPPLKSPSLVNYPECDTNLEELAKQIWGTTEVPGKEEEISYGDGKLFWGGSFTKTDTGELFPDYNSTASLLKAMGAKEDFISSGNGVRYTHRTTDNKDIYFVSNRTDSVINTVCTFGAASDVPELWDPVTGETLVLTSYSIKDGQTTIPLLFDKAQSFFVVFNKQEKTFDHTVTLRSNSPEIIEQNELEGSWQVSFYPQWGGPGNVTFDKLSDWSKK